MKFKEWLKQSLIKQRVDLVNKKIEKQNKKLKEELKQLKAGPPEYTLHYFDGMVRAESIRMLLAHAKIKFEDHRVSF